jgi:hypothetical protein
VNDKNPDRDTADRDASDPQQQPDRVTMGPLEAEPLSGPSRYRKVRTRARLDPRSAADDPLTAVVEVTEPGYRPAEVDVRAVITATLFTARIRPSALAELDRDPRVVSIELGNPAV